MELSPKIRTENQLTNQFDEHQEKIINEPNLELRMKENDEEKMTTLKEKIFNYRQFENHPITKTLETNQKGKFYQIPNEREANHEVFENRKLNIYNEMKDIDNQ
jgi:hypothetical protein